MLSGCRKQAKAKGFRANTKAFRDYVDKCNKDAGGFLHAVFKVNPGLAVMRRSARTGISINLFGSATRLYPAFLSPSELKAGNFDPDNAKRAKMGWEKTCKFWKKIGGNCLLLEKSIKVGAKRKIRRIERNKLKLQDESHITGVDDAAIAGYVTAGIPLITAILGMISKSGGSKNPYLAGKEPADMRSDLDQPDPTDLPTYDPEERSIIDPKTGEEIKTKRGIPVWGWVVIVFIFLILISLLIYQLRKKPAAA